jgi:hypothetical protein
MRSILLSTCFLVCVPIVATAQNAEIRHTTTVDAPPLVWKKVPEAARRANHLSARKGSGLDVAPSTARPFTALPNRPTGRVLRSRSPKKSG